ncbi:MerR family transcriptional regulator [Pseudomonas sp. ZM23]|uniref:MerR family transcriptional regulator n=1 Tax=Pseudomonas triclosanedens TaxID=2961893 RepID=A0ABY6ZVB3_9PSED|nr:MerR family transcriptional regulator [Pseudomonas triclosanedens]MCP8467697.1 MerR family transcriptional regulator [Pseudomonas triclosanedens]MCP8473678.1 MerR family transcriptional regulator [Pseudomonas triclosanedens]MCP8479597.1 MerR family transcriptional regulator [Pseudomonas triclosanedens]WAI48718.1 MerR family transcriptional regulator [Pseudomonas triclosanedens]
MTLDAPHCEADDDYRQALADGWLPIREVARRTGVNPVTLRAWERRYALVVPQRTPKGHRLYSQEQIERIQAILTWLARGVAVSKVRALLDNGAAPAASKGASPWDELLQHCVESVARINERQLDELFNGALAIYPAQTLCEYLMLPLLEQLEWRWQGQFGAQLERVFFHTWLRSKFGTRLYHHKRQQRGAPLLLVNQSELPLEPGLWLSAWLASSAGCPLEVFDWPLPPGELALAVERLSPRAVLLYSSQALNLSQLPRLLAGVDCPRLLAGAAAHIHHEELAGMSLHLAGSPLEAMQCLQELDLFNGEQA